jgi:hypothetical protein
VWQDEAWHTVPQAAQALPGGMRAYLQNLMKSNSLLKHLADCSVKRTHSVCALARREMHSPGW